MTKIKGTNGDDALVATGRSDKVIGGRGDDHLFVEASGARLKGGPGADTFYFIKGNIGSILDFEAGVDTVVVANNNGTTDFFIDGSRLMADYDGVGVDGPKNLEAPKVLFGKGSDLFSLDDLLIL